MRVADFPATRLINGRCLACRRARRREILTHAGWAAFDSVLIVPEKAYYNTDVIIELQGHVVGLEA